ncbi:hypothetical protein MMC10_003194 [Thelotrema lepadinum]|nr:hypothetical protein [Thelotrema lepadinum]
MSTLNLSGTLHFFKLIFNPSLCLPHATISTFNQLPIPLSNAIFAQGSKDGAVARRADIRAVVLDKDNCFARAGENSVFDDYKSHFSLLLQTYPPAQSKLLIVSNSAGTSSGDPSSREANQLELNTGVPVLLHGTKKPGCGTEIMEFFRKHPESGVTHASQVAVVGDRLFTDVMLANTMGAYGVWVEDGVRREQGVVSEEF